MAEETKADSAVDGGCALATVHGCTRFCFAMPRQQSPPWNKDALVALCTLCKLCRARAFTNFSFYDFVMDAAATKTMLYVMRDNAYRVVAGADVSTPAQVVEFFNAHVSGGGVGVGVYADDRPRTLEEVQAFTQSNVHGRIAVLKFGSKRCPPCHALEPALNAVRRTGTAVLSVDAHRDRDATEFYDVTRLPTVLVFVDGTLTAKIVGRNEPQMFHDLANAAEKVCSDNAATAPDT
jgi:thiol-disulfide isomerase/thioredoxin